MSVTSRRSSVTGFLFSSTSNSQLIVFRILFGLVMAGQCLRSVLNGWVKQTYILSDYNFTFFGFEWLNMLHGHFMYFYFAGMILLGLMVSAGLFYRFSILLLSIGWTAIYLSCKTHYNNHYYLLVLLCWLMAVMPANKRFSLDAKLKLTTCTGQCYTWQIWIFIFQTACVYVFAGIAKINDDWLHAIPMKMWLPLKTGKPIIGHFLGNPLMPWIVSYGGLIFDLCIIPGLLYRKTRLLSFFILVGFHVFNGIVFSIGSFPFLGISLCAFFFPASYFDKVFYKKTLPATKLFITDKKIKLLTSMLIVYIAIQVFLPLRHWLIPGDTAWTEEGHRMAWQMMLRSKRGTVYFEIKDKATGHRWTVQPESFVNAESMREVAVLPDVVWQAAQLLKRKYALRQTDVAIYAHTNVSLNFRHGKPLTDSTVDLANVRWNYLWHNDWILKNY